jgi:hypothetical protein
MSKKREQKVRAEKVAREREKQKKNREANVKAEAAVQMKPKKGELPSKLAMDAIADAVHTAVTNVFDEIEATGGNTQPLTPSAKIKGRCLYYAAVGQWVASAILGRDYCVQVGSLMVKTGDESMLKIDAAGGGVAARRFHMWMAADDGGFIEFVDFTSRFFKDWAGEVGAKWERDDLPPYVWGRQKDISDQQGVFYQYEIGGEKEADKMVKANDALVHRIVEQAVTIARKRLLG